MGDNSRWPGVAVLRLSLLVLCVLVLGLVLLWTGVEPARRRLRLSSGSEREEGKAPCSTLMRRLRVQGGQEDRWDSDWDRRGEATTHSNKTTGAHRHLYLVRHGQYHFNTGLLTDLGKLQANYTGRRLRELNHPYKIVIHSTMARAVQTANIVNSHLNLHTSSCQCLEEGGPIEFDPPVSFFSLPKQMYFTDNPRIESAFRKYFHRPDPSQKASSHEIIVAHGNVFRYFVLRALQLNSKAWMRLAIPHGSITSVVLAPDGRVVLDGLGDAGYMPPHRVTY